MAVYALGFFGGEAAADILRERLNDEDRYVRYNAAIALARRGDPAALGILREMLSPADLEKVIRLETSRRRATRSRRSSSKPSRPSRPRPRAQGRTSLAREPPPRDRASAGPASSASGPRPPPS